ncbi:hypothetical protein U3516DRAFT_765274 [Neocallimastix sp. 'constans']
MQPGEMQHFNTTPLVEIQPGEMQFGEMQLSQIFGCGAFRQPLVEMQLGVFQLGEMQSGEMQLSQNFHIYNKAF